MLTYIPKHTTIITINIVRNKKHIGTIDAISFKKADKNKSLYTCCNFTLYKQKIETFYTKNKSFDIKIVSHKNTEKSDSDLIKNCMISKWNGNSLNVGDINSSSEIEVTSYRKRDK